MKNASLVLLAVSMCLWTTGGLAGIASRSSDLTGFTGIISMEKGDTDLVFGGRFSYNYSPFRTIEGTVAYLSPDRTKIYVYQLNVRNNFAVGSGKMVPYVTGGIGAVRYLFDDSVPPDVRALEGTSFALDFGGGMLAFLAPNVAARVDVRDMVVFFGMQTVGYQVIEVGTTHNLEVSVGISMFFFME